MTTCECRCLFADASSQASTQKLAITNLLDVIGNTCEPLPRIIALSPDVRIYAAALIANLLTSHTRPLEAAVWISRHGLEDGNTQLATHF